MLAFVRKCDSGTQGILDSAGLTEALDGRFTPALSQGRF